MPEKASQQPWIVKPASTAARKDWDAAMVARPDIMRAELERLRTRPLERTNPRRTAKLQGNLRYRKIGDRRYEQWQQEITGAGRLWYCPDKAARTIWITKVSLSHPKDSE